MNDDDLNQLASAYLDDETTPDERARVETDHEVTATVARMRAVRALLADVEPAAISMRERQLAAALDAWDRVPHTERAVRDATPTGANAAAVAGAASVSAPPRLSSRRGRRSPSTKWLTAAAAGLIVVLAGGVLLQMNRTANDSGSNTAADASATEATSVTEAASSLRADESDDAPSAAGSEIAREAMDADAATENATDGGQLDTGIDTASPPPDAELPVLLTPDDLALFASDAAEAPAQPDVPAATSAPDLESQSVADEAGGDATIPRCLGVDTVVGPAIYEGIAVVVGIDEGRDLAIAYTAADCEEVARVRLPG